MKNNYFLLWIVSLFSISANAQWVTLYEGGNNTSHSLYNEWQFDLDHTVSQNTTAQIGFGTTDNNFQILCYISPFEGATAGLIKTIPDLEKYASVRVKLRMTLPDSVGVINYYSANYSDVIPVDHENNWTYFGTDILDQYVYLNNVNGDSSINLRTNLLRADSVHLSYDYILIEGDTTQMLSINENSSNEFAVYSAGSQIHISTKNPTEHYQYALVSASGKVILKSEATGNSSVTNDFDSGIYFVVIEGMTSTTTKKVYIN